MTLQRSRKTLATTAAVLALLCLTALPAQADYVSAVEHLDNHRLAQAIVDFKTATAVGDLRAQVALADLALADLVPGMSSQDAVALFRDAAAKGDAVAQLNLGDYYARGAFGLPKDRVQAWIWFSRAANQGRGWAAERRDEVGLVLSGEERSKAVRLLGS